MPGGRALSAARVSPGQRNKSACDTSRAAAVSPELKPPQRNNFVSGSTPARANMKASVPTPDGSNSRILMNNARSDSLAAMADSFSEIKPFANLKMIKSNTMRNFWVVWDSAALLLLLYNVFAVGWEICMCNPRYSFDSMYMGLLVVDYAVDLFFILDLVVRVARIFHIVQPRAKTTQDARRVSVRRDSWQRASFMQVRALKEGKKKRKVWRCPPLCKKLRSFDLFVSLVALLPLEFIGYSLGLPIAPFRLNRVLRMTLFYRYWAAVEDFLDYKGCLPSQKSVIRVAQLFIFMTLASHWCGSVFHLIAWENAHAGIQYTWASNDGLWTHEPVNASDPGGELKVKLIADTATRYVRSIYW